MNKEALKILLIRSFDEELDARSAQMLEEALSSYPWLVEEKKELMAMRDQLTFFSVAEDPTFSDRLMSNLQEAEEPNKQNVTIVQLFPKVAAACFLILLALLLHIYYTQGSIDMDALVGIQDVTPEEAYSYLVWYQ